MSGYLLDTNVVSELSKENPNEAVVRYLNAHDDLWISVIVVEELELGVRLLPEGRRRNELRRWLSQLLTNFEGRMATIGKRKARVGRGFFRCALTLTDGLSNLAMHSSQGQQSPIQ